MQVFLNVWMAAPQAQGSLRKVLNTWVGIFPEAMLAAVARQMGSPVVSIMEQRGLPTQTSVVSVYGGACHAVHRLSDSAMAIVWTPQA